MRPRFEKDLKSFSEVTKEEMATDLSSQGDRAESTKDLSAVIDWHLKKAAERQRTNLEFQQEIYDIQREKQRIMAGLKEQLRCLDNPRCQIESRGGRTTDKIRQGK